MIDHEPDQWSRDPDPEPSTNAGSLAIEAQLVLNTPALDLSATVARSHGEPVTLADVIVATAVKQLAGGTDDWNSLRKRVTEITNEEIRAQVIELIREALMTGVQRTNTYGEVVGSPTTLRDLIVADVGKALAPKNDPYSREVSPLQQVIRDEVNRAFVDELSKVVKAEKAKILKAMKEQAAGILTQAVAAGLRAS